MSNIKIGGFSFIFFSFNYQIQIHHPKIWYSASFQKAEDEKELQKRKSYGKECPKIFDKLEPAKLSAWRACVLVCIHACGLMCLACLRTLVLVCLHAWHA